MAVREDVVLVADGGEVTAGRQKHTFVYGEFNVRLPEGVEQVETDERLADGFVYRPEGVIAPFDVGFARADVTVDLEVQSTDLELVVDEAQRDAEGEIFFERDITPAGLGEFVPGVDFVVGDVVSVERWRVLLPLPVTGWEMVSSASDGVVADRVHVSGQLVSDAVARGRRNADLRRQVEADKRQLQRSVQSVRSAVSVERSERVSDVDSVRVVLGGARASEESLVSQLAAVQAQITGMVGVGETPPAPGLLNSYLWMNTKLWEAQQDINRLNEQFQAEVRARQRDQAVLDARQDVQAQQIAMAVPRIASIKEGVNDSAENDFFRLYIEEQDPDVRGKWIFRIQLKRGWEGSMIVLARSDVSPMEVYTFVVSDGGFVVRQSVLPAYTFSWPRKGLATVAIGVANPPV